MNKKNNPKLKILIITSLIFGIIILGYTSNFAKLSLQDNEKSAKAIPHGGCNTCHLNHNAPGSQISMADGNANLCISCHNPAGLASAKPLSDAMKAIPGVSGNSHSWNVLATNLIYETNTPTDSEMILRIYGDTIVCSTCHDQHSQAYPPFLRISNAGDGLCKQCHTARNVGKYLDNTTANKGSHPVGLKYDGTNPNLNSSPTAPLLLVGSSSDSLECSSCHQLHYATSTDGNILRTTNDNNLCKSCHTYTGHMTFSCKDCHQTHNPNKTNIYLTKDTISTPNSGYIATILADTSGLNSYADGNSTYDGICEACHTTTKYHRNNSSGDHSHYTATNCITCHTHEGEFLHGGGGNCKECHGHDVGYEYEPGLFSQGKGTAHSHSTHTELDSDDQIGPFISCETCHDTLNYPSFKSGTDINGDLEIDLSETDVCDNCHSANGLFDGVNDAIIGAKNNWTNGIYSGTNLPTDKNNWCAGCHDADRSSTNQDGTGVLAPDVAGDSTNYGFYYSGHGKNTLINCTDCHNPRDRHIDGDARTYSYVDSIANLTGDVYRKGYRLNKINGYEPMRIPLNDTSILPLDTVNFRLCVSCHSFKNLMDTSVTYATNFNHSGTNAPYSFGYGEVTERNDHLHNHLDFPAHSGEEPYWDSDWDFNTTAIVQGSNNPEVNGYDSYITCVTCHDVHGGKDFGGNTGGNMMRDGRLQGREPGLKFTYLIEASGGLPLVTSVGANKENSIGGVIRSGVNYRAGFYGTPSNTICGGCHKEVYPTTDEYDATGNGGSGCTPCHPFSTSSSYFMEYYRTPTITDCNLCHSQPPDGTAFPNTAGSHKMHMNDPRGPNITDCSVCHASADSVTHINQIASFASGTDANSNGNIDLSETDVCDNCHSPNGTYDGVDDAIIGAKNNWTNGVYTGTNLTTGKEKWCATCHDESPANSKADGTGVSAPKIAGDESANARYGVGYGYYKTGHGLPTNETYPASGGVTSGAGLECIACHDYSKTHIDHIARTFDDGNVSTTSPSVYSNAYRLKLVGGLEPMQIPLPTTSPANRVDQFRLCYSCHDSGPFLSSTNMNTNLVTDGVNRHEYHLKYNSYRWSSDWDGTNNSRMTCISCHNVHGSDRMTMVRDGKLINSEPGLQIWYNNDALTEYLDYNPDPPTPEDVKLIASTGTLWIGGSSSNLCSHCHGNGNTKPEYRDPFQDVNTAPWLEWVGDVDFVNDGINPDTCYSGSDVLFRVNYFDENNDFPTIYKLLVDADGDGVTDSIDMNIAIGDEDFTDGSAYSVIVNMKKSLISGPGNVDYRFYFVSTDSVATGIPTTNHQLYIKNNAPTIDWSGNLFFENDGVHPNVGPIGNFNFEIVYTDIDGDGPSTMNLVIDDVLPGYTMTAGIGSVETGITYSTSVALSTPGNHTYRFMAVDNAVWGDTATLELEPVANNSFTITNTPNNIPTLDYVNSSCFTNSVMPVRGPIGGDYDFNIIYTDLDNEAPININVVVDGTNYPLSPIGGSILTGLTYGTTIQINTVGDHYYYFTADDGTDAAIGEPTTVNGDTLSVINALKVNLNDTRPGWYGSIQAAIDAYSDTIIMVYPATYNEKLELYNGGDDKLTIESVCGAENTIIDSTGWVVFIQNVPTYTKIIGFTITGGLDGVRINNGKPEIIDCIITDNSEHGVNSTNPGNKMTIVNTIIRNNNPSGATANIYGAGVMFNGGALQHSIIGCTITNNQASVRGGGIYAQNISTGNLTIISTEISDNIAATGGGGIGVNSANLFVDKSIIISNTTGTAVGGGFFVQGSGYTFDINNTIIAKNIADDGPGMWINSGVNVTIANSLFEGNTTSDIVGGRGGAIFTYDVDPMITNTIFWNNTAGTSAQRGQDCFAHPTGAVFTLSYCVFVNNLTQMSGAGTFVVDSTSFNSDPRFTDAPNGDYRPLYFSPCIDFGTSTGAPTDDINGLLRGIDGKGDGNVTGDFSDYDIGPYEYKP